MELVFLSHASSGAVLLSLLTHVILKRSEEMLTKLHEKKLAQCNSQMRQTPLS